LTRGDMVQLAQKSTPGFEVVVQEEEIDNPWHSVPTAKEVVDDLASDAAVGLSSGEFGVSQGRRWVARCE